MPVTLPTNEYVEVREGGYYVAGTRIGLDVLVYRFREGKSPESLLSAYPSLGTLAKVYGAITFVLEHPGEIEAYLRDQEKLWDEFREKHPIPEEMRDRLLRAAKDRSPQPSREFSFKRTPTSIQPLGLV